MEVIIQVFPDGFHLRTLEMFLDACSKLNKAVNVKRSACSPLLCFSSSHSPLSLSNTSIISSLIDRLARFAATEEGGIPSDISLFDIFSKQTQLVYEARPDMPVQDVIALQVSLLNMTISCYPGNLANIDQVLKVTNEKIAASSESKG